MLNFNFYLFCSFKYNLYVLILNLYIFLYKFNQIKPININTKRQEINYLLQNSLLIFNNNIINNCQNINYKTDSIINKVDQILDKSVTNRPKLLINNNIIKNMTYNIS